MPKDIAQVSSASILKRVFGMWPYLFLAVSIVGLAYVVLNGYLVSR